MKISKNITSCTKPLEINEND